MFTKMFKRRLLPAPPPPELSSPSWSYQVHVMTQVLKLVSSIKATPSESAKMIGVYLYRADVAGRVVQFFFILNDIAV